jgi:cardiolipin synthase
MSNIKLSISNIKSAFIRVHPRFLSALIRVYQRFLPSANGADSASEARNRHFELTRVITVPNVLSLSRLILLPAISLLLLARQALPALLLMLVSWLTDALDGYLARRLNQVTTLGKILDHVVDKIWVGTILVMLVATRGLPVYIAAAVIGRDLLIVIGSLVIADRRRRVVSSNVVGKITGTAFALTMLLYVVDNGYPGLQMPKHVMLWVVTGLIVVSFGNYVIVYVRAMSLGRSVAAPPPGASSLEPRTTNHE